MEVRKMDHIKILKRAFEIVWNYRVLWVFGIIIALTTAGSGGGGNAANYSGSGNWGQAPWEGEFEIPTWLELPAQTQMAIIAVGIGLLCLFLLLGIVFIVLHYVSANALIQMVAEHEETGEKYTVRQGFRIGWSRTAWRLFLIKLVVALPIVVVFILLFGLACVPLLLWVTKSQAAGIFGTLVTIGMVLLLVFLAIIVAAILSPLIEFFWRACVLEELNVLNAIRVGFDLVKRHLQDVGIMWLIMIGVRIGWGIALMIVALLLFPVILALIIVAALAGGVPALIVGLLARVLLSSTEAAVVIAALVGLPIFAIIVGAPWIFLDGLMEAFKSSVWTLTYRELRAVDELAYEGGSENRDEEDECGGGHNP